MGRLVYLGLFVSALFLSPLGVCGDNDNNEDFDSIPSSYLNYVVEVNKAFTDLSHSPNFNMDSRTSAILNVAIHDAVNSIEPKYETYSGVVPVPNPHASIPAAIVAIYREVALTDTATSVRGNSAEKFFTPADQLARNAIIEDNYAQLLGSIRTSSAKLNAGIAVGLAAAQQVYALRENDKAFEIFNFTAGCDLRPGVWNECSYAPLIIPMYYNWKFVTPWVISNLEDHRVPPPPALNSATYKDSLALVYAYGSRFSTVRTQAQTDQGLFWNSASGPVESNLISQNVLRTYGNNVDVHTSARVMALATMAAADSVISNVENKQLYNFWRPFEAFKYGGGAQYPLIQQQPWDPLVATPGSSEYPAGHPTQTSAGSHALALALGITGSTPFPSPITFATRRFPNVAPSVPHTFRTTDEFQESVVMGRVYTGHHLKHSDVVGRAAGRKVAEEVVANALKLLV